MTRTPSILAAALAATMLLAACAGTPPASDLAADTAPGTAARTAGAGAPDCAALQVQITQAGDAQRQAAQKQHDAWKTVVPVAALARYGQGAVEAAQSQQRLDDLNGQALRLGCQGSGVVAGGARGEGLSTTSQGQGLRVRSFN